MGFSIAPGSFGATGAFNGSQDLISLTENLPKNGVFKFQMVIFWLQSADFIITK